MHIQLKNIIICTLQNVLFYPLLVFATLLTVIISIPWLLFDKNFGYHRGPVRWWLWFLLTAIRVIYSIDVKTKNMPPRLNDFNDHGCILAIAHQSFLDILLAAYLFPNGVYVLKSSLRYFFPLNIFFNRFGFIYVDRGKKGKSMPQLLEYSHKTLEKGGHIFIYPEGSRCDVHHKTTFKKGLFVMAEMFHHTPILPVVHQAGLFWPRRSFFKNNGTIIWQCLDVIPPATNKQQKQIRLERLENLEKEMFLERKSLLSDKKIIQ